MKTANTRLWRRWGVNRSPCWWNESPRSEATPTCSSKGKDGISFIIAERYTGKGHPVDLSDTDEWGSGMSDIDMFLDYLRLQCDGVIMPNRLPGDTELSLNLSSTSVQLEQTPALV